ncbi:hypothetical protein DL96DRAFT_1669498 [Flagelloscypha sp. PMI_526]|nr:hypothetical protein DL96DRAFT_1669498 [Flagelloscypha sp. PMI_526]
MASMALNPPSHPENAPVFTRASLLEYPSRYPTTAYPSSSPGVNPGASLAVSQPSSPLTPTSATTQYYSQGTASLQGQSPSYERTQFAPSPLQSTSRPDELVSDPRLSPQQHDPALVQQRPVSQLMDANRMPGAGYSNPIIPLSASPTYSPPISQSPRVQAHQPTYINQPTPPNPLNPVFSPAPRRPQEEVCVECAMRDQDMADVDVTSPGVWERESDAAIEDLKRREMEDEANGIPFPVDRPCTRGHPLTEKHIKIWLSINPREPTSKHKNLYTYVKSQRTLIEKEALAYAQAQQEARNLDSRMRDTYSELRRSAYDLGNSAAPQDHTGGVRIKPPQANGTMPHARSHSRDVTLLENGMIVEHVDVRREEREARERRRREEKRARKPSRSSTYGDVTSIISTNSVMPQTDSGVGLNPYSRYSQASLGRPMSVLTNGSRGDVIPRAYSQASFSDVHSLSSASPRRSRFFGNFGSGFRSQNSLAPSGFSGSMVDMHLALHDSAHGPRQSVLDPNTIRQSQLWSASPQQESPSSPYGNEEPKKKKKGLAKIWDKMKGGSKTPKQDTISSRGTSHTFDRQMEDNYQLTPPPPLSSLVRGESSRQGSSTPSLPTSIPSQKTSGMSGQGLSPPTPPSSILPSPISSRPSEHPEITVDTRRSIYGEEVDLAGDETIGKHISRNIHPATSEPDFRRRLSIAPNAGSIPPIPQSPMLQPITASPITQDKSLPPLPGNDNTPVEARPQTVYTYDTAFRTSDMRRQSFSGTSAPTDFPMMSSNKSATMDTRRMIRPSGYNEFGASRHSLGNVLDHPNRNGTASPVPSAKRKSKFGLGSLLGKKRKESFSDESLQQGYGPGGYSDGEMGYGTMRSGHESVGVGARKFYIVAQDSEFVAYRYPSGDTRLDLLR